MSSTDASTETPEVGTVDMKLEVVTLPVSDVDRAERFDQSRGWRTDADFALGDDVRAVQLTPPDSPCSIADAAREDLIGRGVDVSEVFHRDGARLVAGPDPEWDD
jgi:hypothetical protein